MILHLQCVPLPAISAACDSDSARTPFIPLNPIPGHNDRIALALFAGKGWGVGCESRIVICDGLELPSDDLSAQREVSSFG
jgi:hypothetical protein